MNIPTKRLIEFVDLTPRVEAVIGAENNNVTILREYKATKSEKRETPGIISCTYPTTFWLSWKDRIPTLGRGTTVGEHILLKLYDLALPNDIVGVDFRTSQTDGMWEIAEDEGRFFG